jgi:myosin-5
LKAVASRVVANDKTDILMLDATPLEDSGPFEVPSPRDVAPPDNYLPAWYIKYIYIFILFFISNFN